MKLAIFIPTYNRPDMIEKLLTPELDALLQINADVYIGDSSEKDDTERIVTAFQNKYPNLFYERMAPEISSNAKVYLYYEKLGSMPQYDYVWVRHDHTFLNGKILMTIPDMLADTPDIIILRRHSSSAENGTAYRDIGTFFEEQFWSLTLYGGYILRRDTMLWNVDWNALRKKYLIKDLENFSHTAHALEQIASFESFFAVCRYIDGASVCAETFPRKIEDYFYFHNICIPNVINRLPEVYTPAQKQKLIDRARNRLIDDETGGGILYQYNSLLRGKANGTFTVKNYCNAYRIARKYHVPFYPGVFPMLIAIVPGRIVRLWIRRSFHRVLRKFCRRFEKVYIYGAGKLGLLLSDYMQGNGFAFDGFVVTSLVNQEQSIANIPVMELEQVLRDGSIGFLVAVGKASRAQIETLLRKHGFADNYIFLDATLVHSPQDARKTN